MTSSTPPTGKSKRISSSKKGANRPISAENVEKFLQDNPEILNDRPDLLASIKPPEQNYGGGVVDMQVFMLKRLQDELGKYKLREKNFLKAAELNNKVQTRILEAVSTLLDTSSFDEICEIVKQKLPSLFDIELAVICIEANKHNPNQELGTEVTIVETGTINSILDNGNKISLRSNIKGNKAVFGAAASKIRSEALLPLDLGPNKLNALLALGSVKSDEFSPAQGAELLCFFSNVLQKMMQRWINLNP